MPFFPARVVPPGSFQGAVENFSFSACSLALPRSRYFRVLILLFAYSLFLFYHLRLLTLTLSLLPIPFTSSQVNAAKALQDTSDDWTRRRADPCLLMIKYLYHVKEKKRCAATKESDAQQLQTHASLLISFYYLLFLLAFSAPTERSHLSDSPPALDPPPSLYLLYTFKNRSSIGLSWIFDCVLVLPGHQRKAHPAQLPLFPTPPNPPPCTPHFASLASFSFHVTPTF